jgi:hypothetical protein
MYSCKEFCVASFCASICQHNHERSECKGHGHCQHYHIQRPLHATARNAGARASAIMSASGASARAAGARASACITARGAAARAAGARASASITARGATASAAGTKSSGGTGICQHSRIFSTCQCQGCGGASICQHYHVVTAPLQGLARAGTSITASGAPASGCGGASTCQHIRIRVRSTCKGCRGASIGLACDQAIAMMIT